MTAATAFVATRRAVTVRPWIPVAGYATIVILLLVTHHGTTLRWFVPIVGMLTALWVYLHAQFAAFAAFTWCFWFVIPGLRRLAEYQGGGWDPQDPISLAPFMVTGIATLTVVRRMPELRRAGLVPWVLAIGCILYGFFVGVLRSGPLAATHSLVAWMIPLLFGLAVALEWRKYPALAMHTTRIFVLAGLVLSAYAIVQFVNPPIWDRLWVTGSGMTSVGYPEPFRLRVFSLMNGPLLFSVMLCAAVLLSLSARGALRMAAMLACVVALLLTFVRSAWLITILAGAVYLYALPMRFVRRTVLTIAAMVVLIWGVGQLLPRDISDSVITAIQLRARSLGNLHQDLSYAQRTGFMDQISGVVLEDPLGHGLGSTGVSSTLGDPPTGIKDFDSGIFAVLYSLGWFAGAALLSIAAYVTVRCMRRREPANDRTAKAARAIVVGMLVLNIGGNVFEGFAALVFWGFAGLVLASHQWQAAQALRPTRSVRA
jgi:hypothetical protein